MRQMFLLYIPPGPRRLSATSRTSLKSPSTEPPRHAPYRIDIATALKRGKNEVTIKITNAWVNRLIGDQQPNVRIITFTDVTPYAASSPLLPFDLIGPVQVLREPTE